jgi:hypothetical protein
VLGSFVAGCGLVQRLAVPTAVKLNNELVNPIAGFVGHEQEQFEATLVTAAQSTPDFRVFVSPASLPIASFSWRFADGRGQSYKQDDDTACAEYRKGLLVLTPPPPLAKPCPQRRWSLVSRAYHIPGPPILPALHDEAPSCLG